MMAKFRQAFARGTAPILNVALEIGVSKELRVVVDGVVMYRGLSFAQANRVYKQYLKKMDAQMKASA